MKAAVYSLYPSRVAAFAAVVGAVTGLVFGSLGCARDAGGGEQRTAARQPVGDTRPVVKQGGNVPPQPARLDRQDPPLVEAARAGDARRVRTLLDSGADVNAFGAGRTTALMAAAEAGRADMAQLLMDRNADANLRNAKGQTAADLADAGGHRQLRALLERKEVKPPPGPANPVPEK